MNPEDFVKDAIAKNKVMVFSKSYCPFCHMAKDALKKFTDEFTVVELDGRPDVNDIQKVLGNMTGETTVPRVFIDGKFVGGGSECAKLAESGQLKELLQKAQVTMK